MTRKVRNKTRTETFDSPVALRKAQQEVATFHRFQQLCAQLIEVSERICALRPVVETLTPEEKNSADDPVGDRAGSEHSAGTRLRRTAPERAHGSGSRGDGPSLWDAPGGSSGAHRVVALRPTVSGSTQLALSLRPQGALPGIALQDGSQCRRRGARIAALLSVHPLSPGPVSRGRRIGH